MKFFLYIAIFVFLFISCSSGSNSKVDEEQTDSYDISDDDGIKTFQWKAITAGEQHTCGITASDNLYCWGANIVNGTNNIQYTPTKISDEAWTSVMAFGFHSCGISFSSNKLYCWGNNGQGQLGDGTTTYETVPTRIGNDENAWLNISVGGYHTCGIHSADNSLYCWGGNEYGQLGDGTSGTDSDPTIADKYIPTKIGDDKWQYVSAGLSHTCGISAASDKLYCWGDNNYGQLGDGTNAQKNIPTKIGNEEWQNVSAAGAYSCGITKEKKLYCWGLNLQGQLGDGSYAQKNTPTQIGEAVWLAVTAGEGHTCSIQTDNSLYCWGWAGGGGLTNNIPTKMNNDKWIAITVGGTHTCGIKTGNKLYCWGGNNYGELGDGTTERKNTPTLVTEP